MKYRFSIFTLSIHQLLSSSNSFLLHSYKSPSYIPSTKYSTKLSANSDVDSNEIAAKEALKKTKQQLLKLSTSSSSISPSSDINKDDPYAIERQAMYQKYIQQPANAIKTELMELNLNAKGRKPDLANRLVQFHLDQKYSQDTKVDDIKESNKIPQSDDLEIDSHQASLTSFASLNPLSAQASTAFASAQIQSPTDIQIKAIPEINNGENMILHAETGSGKTLAYLLPVTEHLQNRLSSPANISDKEQEPLCVILTPSRELASQVAGVAQALAPEGCVRLITEPTNLADDEGRGQVEKGEVSVYGGRIDRQSVRRQKIGRIIIGSAKSIMISLYGSPKLPAPPTPKPAAKLFLRSVNWLILDEVDRLLNVPKTRKDKRSSKKKHEKPAAILASGISRLTLSRAQIIACSATVGRPLRRELARVMGLPPQESPEIIRAESEGYEMEGAHLGRFVTIPKTVKHFALPCDGMSSGSLLTAASFAAKKLANQKILMVLTNNCGLTPRDTIGALRHLNAHANPQTLADALEGKDNEGEVAISGTEQLIQTHRDVSRSMGVGQSVDNQEGYLLVTVEDSCRGLHLDQLDLVIVIGRPKGPDEYTHIAGRTGRAGCEGGKVLNVVSYEQAAALTSWEKMLNVQFLPIEMEEIEEELIS